MTKDLDRTQLLWQRAGNKQPTTARKKTNKKKNSSRPPVLLAACEPLVSPGSRNWRWQLVAKVLVFHYSEWTNEGAILQAVWGQTVRAGACLRWLQGPTHGTVSRGSSRHDSSVATAERRTSCCFLPASTPVAHTALDVTTPPPHHYFSLGVSYTMTLSTGKYV